MKKKNKRVARNRYLIVCEGLTEYLYISEMKKHFLKNTNKHIIDINITQTDGTNPSSLYEFTKNEVNKSIRERNAYELAFIVYDRDLHPDFNKIANEIEKEKKIKNAFTSLCLEQWFLIHFKHTNRKFDNPEQVIKELKKHFPSYKKNQKNFNLLEDKFESAVIYAEKINKKNKFNLIKDKDPYFGLINIINFLNNLI